MGKKISQLDDNIAITSGDFVELSQDDSGTQTSTKATLGDLVTFLGDSFVNVTGDTMTGALTFSNGADTGSIDIDGSGDMAIFPEGSNNILTLNSASAGTNNTGQTITGRFRYSMPIEQENSAATLGSGSSGVTTALVRCSNGSPVTLTIRKNDSTPGLDFQKGNFFSVMQEGAGQVTLVGQTGNVVLGIPAGFIAATRDQYSVISATLYEISETDELWVISGDLAEAP